MGLSPKQMGEAIIRNLKEKTGKTLDEWIAVLQESQLEDKKEMIDFLKSEQGLGHFQARTVYDEYIAQSK